MVSYSKAQELLLKRKNSVNEARALVTSKKWAKHINAVKEGYKRNFGKDIPENVLNTTAVCLENTQRFIAKQANEATGVNNMANFVDYGLGIITAVMPALVANELVSVQPLKARNGEIFYMNYTYGSNKAGQTVGQSMISPFTGVNGNQYYTSEHNSGEVIAHASTTGSSAKLEGVLSYLPVRAGSVEISVGASILVDDGKGALAVKSGSSFDDFTSGTIDYQTGAVVINVNKVDSETDVLAAYDFDFGNGGVGSAANIPEVGVELGTLPIATVARSLRARWLFDVDFEFQETHGVNIENELAAAMAAEVRHEIDMEILNDLYVQANAGGMAFTWNKTPGSGVSYIDHKDTLVDTFIRMSNAIFGDTQRAEGNFIVCGLDVATVVESLTGRFVPAPSNNGTPKAGPHIIGTLNGRWTVVKNPFYKSTDFVVGAKGASHLEAGYVYAPYLPLYTTPTVMLDDFVQRKGVRTRYGKKMLNTKFYAKGSIVG